MPPTSVDKILESMMMQMLNPDQNAANVVCCNCFQVKKKECQRSSQTCCKCQKNNTPNKRKKSRRKLKKTCLKTIICLTKMMAKDGGECQGFSCDPCCSNMREDKDERFCAKCGQLLPGVVPAGQPLDQPDQCLQHLERCQQECKDMGVQVNVERTEPLSVRIKVCTCPYSNPRSQDDKLYHSLSLPELSSTNPRLVDDATSENLVSGRVPQTRFGDSNYDVPRQSHPPLKGLNETAPEWPVDMASVKKLALNMAKARLVEEAACWEREHARRYLHQGRKQEINEQATDDSSDVDPRKKANADGGPGVQRRSVGVPFEGEQGQTTYPRNYLYYNQTRDTYGCNGYQGTTDFGVSYSPMQDIAGGCCAGTDVYCYNSENGPSPFGDHCQHACTCGSAAQFQPYQVRGPYSGYPYKNIPYQEECSEQQDRSRPVPYNWSYGSSGNRPPSPCR